MSKDALTIVDQGWLLLASEEGPAPPGGADSEAIPPNATRPIPTEVLRDLLKHEAKDDDDPSSDGVQLETEDEPLPPVLEVTPRADDVVFDPRSCPTRTRRP